MNRIIIGGLDLNFYEDVLDNGLKVILCKIPRNSVHARISTFFGGSNLEFKLSSEKEFTKVPAGVAHFLEHKLFELKDLKKMVLIVMLLLPLLLLHIIFLVVKSFMIT